MKDDLQVEARIEPIDPEADRNSTQDGRDTMQPCSVGFFGKKVAISWGNGWGRLFFIRRRVYFVALIMLMILAILLGIFLSRVHSTNSSVYVDLGYARYRGTKNSVTGISQWLGMRYAAPPLGDLRFRAARDPLNMTGIQDATKNRPICLATNATKLVDTTSEDCLFINIFTPSNTTGRSLPTYIFIQGGGFNHLGNANYDGTSLIQASGHEIVIVTFNYRVGPYGFLTSKEVQSNGDLNIGLTDQRKVFQWVQKYISYFGGDPNSVTIGGDSAGAASIDLHLTAFGGRDDGLFHAAVAESQSFGPQLHISESQYQYDALVSRTGCSNANDTLQCLRDLDVGTLQAENIDVPYPNCSGLPLFMYSSVVDGDFIWDSTYKLYAEGRFIKVPVIFGDTTNEGTIFATKNISSYSEMNMFLKDNFPKITDDQLEEVDGLYPEAEQFSNRGTYWRTAANAYGEMRYNCPGIFISSAYDNASVVGNWNYHFNVHDPTQSTSGLGVSHTIEVTAIWGGPPYVPSGTPSSYTTPLNSGIIPIMQGYWTSFIRAHNPNTFRYVGTPVWERFSVGGMERILLETNGSRMEVVDAGQRGRCEVLWGLGGEIGQ